MSKLPTSPSHRCTCISLNLQHSHPDGKLTRVIDDKTKSQTCICDLWPTHKLWQKLKCRKRHLTWSHLMSLARLQNWWQITPNNQPLACGNHIRSPPSREFRAHSRIQDSVQHLFTKAPEFHRLWKNCPCFWALGLINVFTHHQPDCYIWILTVTPN